MQRSRQYLSNDTIYKIYTIYSYNDINGNAFFNQ